MNRFIPKEKMSKKARKELEKQKRAEWSFSPVTRRIESKKLYNRKKRPCNRYDEYGTGAFVYLYFS